MQLAMTGKIWDQCKEMCKKEMPGWVGWPQTRPHLWAIGGQDAEGIARDVCQR